MARIGVARPGGGYDLVPLLESPCMSCHRGSATETLIDGSPICIPCREAANRWIRLFGGHMGFLMRDHVLAFMCYRDAVPVGEHYRHMHADRCRKVT